MRRSKLVVAVSAALALASCVNSASNHPPQEDAADSSAVRQASPANTNAAAALDFGSDHRFPSGLVVSVSEPDVFQPSDNAYPQTQRAAAFGILLFNDRDKPYRLSNLSVTATIDDESIKQVKDASQGYNGIIDADSDIGPGNTTRLKLAFALPESPNSVRVVLSPDSTSPDQVVFQGSV